MLKQRNKNLNMYTINFKKQTTMQLRVKRGQGNLFINKQTLKTFFNNNLLLLQKLKVLNDYKKKFMKYNIYITVKGGGLENQFQTILISICNLLQKWNYLNENNLKNYGILMNDLRKKERKKYGLKKARKASQFSKR